MVKNVHIGPVRVERAWRFAEKSVNLDVSALAMGGGGHHLLPQTLSVGELARENERLRRDIDNLLQDLTNDRASRKTLGLPPYSAGRRSGDDLYEP